MLSQRASASPNSMRQRQDRSREMSGLTADRQDECAHVVAGTWIWSRALVLLSLSAYLLFAHGCHGDDDHELFARTSRFVVSPKTRGFKL
jgi:hypothetical protein